MAGLNPSFMEWTHSPMSPADQEFDTYAVAFMCCTFELLNK